MSRSTDERGQVTAFVTVLTITLLFAGGLVLDGGYILTTHRQAMADARNAARAGAQGLAVEQVRGGSGATAIADPDRARQRVDEYLDRIGRTDYTVSTTDTSVTVTVRLQYDLLILPGGTKTVSGRSTARSVHGVSGADT